MAASLLTSTASAAAPATGGSSSAQVHNLVDTFSRTTQNGLGTADLGGAWNTWPDQDFAVASGSATVGPIAAGTAVHAALGTTTYADEQLHVALSLPQLADSGSGTYFALEFRRQANGDSYRARLHVAAGGALSIGFTRMLGGKETPVGPTTDLHLGLAAGQTVHFEASVSGSPAVSLRSRAWLEGAATPDWELTTGETTSADIAQPGTVGISIYQAPSSTNGLVRLLGIDGWSGTPTASTDSSQATASSSGTASASTPTAVGSAAGQTAASTTSASASAPAGSAPVGTTSYPIPAHAIFVSVNGNDQTATGSVSAPFQTLTRAVAAAPSGATIVMRAGSYHEDVVVPADKTLTIQSYPKEAVWLDGSSVVTGWTASGGAWVHDNWTAHFDHTAGYTPAIAANDKPSWGWVNPAYPMAAYPDQTWINSTALKQVGSRDDVTAGTFYVDYDNKQLWVGSSPVGQTVRGSDLPVAIMFQSPGSTLRGIGVRRYATPVSSIGTVRLRGNGDSLANVVVTDNATEGIDATATNLILTNVTSQNNGLLGIHASYADHLSISKSLVQNNNTEHFNYSPVAGGIKVTSSRTVSVVSSTITDNIGTGLWFDESTYNMNVSGDVIKGNLMRGLTMEISAQGIVVGNLFQNNGSEGVYVEDTNNVQLWNNTFINNVRDLEVYQDTRQNTQSTPGHDPRQQYPDPTMPWIAKNINVSNNVMQTGWPFLIFVADGSGQRTASEMAVHVDGNYFDRPTNRRDWAIAWGQSGSKTRSFSAATFPAATGQGYSNRDAPATSDRFSQSTMASRGKPLPLPSDVAAVAGQAAGEKHLGTF